MMLRVPSVAPEPIPVDCLKAFGRLVESWFGLAQPARNLQTLERRLRAALSCSSRLLMFHFCLRSSTR